MERRASCLHLCRIRDDVARVAGVACVSCWVSLLLAETPAVGVRN
jgi:hypothetical protein